MGKRNPFAGVRTDDLPDSLRDMARVIGLPAVLGIVAAKGGRRVYIPAKVRPDHWLVQAAGEKAARLLCQHHEREEIDIPRATGAILAARDRRIREAYRTGAAVPHLADQFSLSRSEIYRICQDVERDSVPTAVRPPEPTPTAPRRRSRHHDPRQRALSF